MSQVVNLLEVLWAYERMKESTLLSDGEKQIIRKQLLHALPLEMHCTQSLLTRNIIASHLDQSPSISGVYHTKPDEELIATRDTIDHPIRVTSPKVVPKGRQKK